MDFGIFRHRVKNVLVLSSWGNRRRWVDTNVVLSLMDDEFREELHAAGDMPNGMWSSEQAFVDAYCKLYLVKYGEEFTID